ncbi:MAG: DNA polymerase-3 subunit chi [Parvicella sp.]|jgi:DNA polymerase-3 subunit chi
MSTQVDFYLFEHDDEQRMIQTVCKLANKAVGAGLRLFIQTANDIQSRKLDDALWAFSADSFLPHETQTKGVMATDPIVIGCEINANNQRDMLISLIETVQSPLSHFARIADIVLGNEIAKSKARQRYAVYRDQGAAVKAHPLKQ